MIDTNQRNPSMDATNDPHANEYRAAVEHIREQTSPPAVAWKVGQPVSGTSAGRRWSGTVAALGGRMLMVDIDGATLYVPAADATDGG
jgi:hypothetical protein